jgi:hypothetical protein
LSFHPSDSGIIPYVRLPGYPLFRGKINMNALATTNGQNPTGTNLLPV